MKILRTTGLAHEQSNSNKAARLSRVECMKREIARQSSNVSEKYQIFIRKKLADTIKSTSIVERKRFYLKAIFIHIWQIILSTIWYSITCKTYTHTHMISVTAQEALGGGTIKLFILLTTLALAKIFVGSDYHINMGVW